MSPSHCRPLAILRRGFLLLLVFFLSRVSSGNKLVALAQCLPDQGAALLRLKQGFHRSASGNASSSLLPSWTPGTDCCRGWAGVTCDGASGRVISLDLSNSSISGTVHPALSNLTSLRSLDLSCNQLNPVAMPLQLFMLANLTHLNLSNSGFSGQIPADISSLRGLISLDLSASGICSQSSLSLQNPGLGTLVGGLANLTRLYLDGVNISAGGQEWGRALSSSVPNLRELSLSACSLSGAIDTSFSRLRSLTLLRLNQNNLSSAVPEFLGNFSLLRFLRLSSCGLRGSLPESIFALPRLTTLDVSKNPMLSGRLPEFPVGSVLESLVLFETNVSGKLPDSIGNLNFLKMLKLSNCNFSGSLPASFGSLRQLVHVDLSVNKFTGPIPSLSSANLLTLDLQNNSLTGQIPARLFELPSLQTLQLNSNQLSGDLGEFSAKNSPLQTVDLSNNKLQGLLPTSVSRLRVLKVLKVASNNLSGTVELDMFASFRNLSILDLSNNMLTVKTSSPSTSFPNVSTLNLASCGVGEFPDFLRNQAKLSRLDLSNNRIRGVIPDWLWRVGNRTLVYLNISHNSLTGFESPPDFSNSSLIVLDIHNNMLEGPFLRPPPSILVVDYSNNRFTSSMPADIGSSLGFTIFFSVSNNSLAGGIPESICNSTYLQVLDLSHNNLTGQIPRCYFAWETDLRVLNLRGNMLNGTVPQGFGEGCKLRSLNLNGNNLEGTVPYNLSACKMLEVLDLGNNQMEGSFPSWLGCLSQLRVLVLRSNRFSGSIPGMRGGNYTFSMLQIMDLSSNNFSGRLPSESFRKWKAMTAMDEQPGRPVVAFGFLDLTHLYYQDTVTVTSKGLEMTLVKILTIFTSIDVSNNKFEGSIPEEVGELRALYVLNMSFNHLTGGIPSSVGNLTLLESLDLSSNNLSGEIPLGLASLSFLAALNLSFNRLVGQIPQGRQITTFSSASFEGNEGLCGPPLTNTCSNNNAAPGSSASKSILELDWEFIFIGMGYGGGLALVLGPFVSWSTGRRWYNKHVDRILWAVIPSCLWLCCDCREGKVDAEKGEDGSDTEEEEEGQKRRFCVFCTQMEFSGDRVIVRHGHCACALEE